MRINCSLGNITHITVLCMFLIINALNAQKSGGKFISKEDGAVDLSEFLNSTTGFLPVPIIITEPAVGYGGGLVLAYFHKKRKAQSSEVAQNPEGAKGITPTVSFAAGGYTENGTWFVGGGHQGSYLNNRIRYLGVMMYTSANLDFYASGNEILNGKYRFNIKGFLTLQELLYKIKKETPFFLGLNYTYFGNDVSFKTGIDIPELEELSFQTSIGGMNTVFLWDSRNNSLTPTKGIMSTIELGWFDPAFGGNTSYGNFDSRFYFYAPIGGEKLFSGYRLNVVSRWGEVPFYARPFISLRGIPALRYQNDNVYTVETEWRWNIINRWSLVGFIGAGEALETYGDIFSDVKVAGGTGFRYFLAKQYGLHAGIDIARGPEIWAWNITVGSNWGR